jgi:hypothetical protein
MPPLGGIRVKIYEGQMESADMRLEDRGCYTETEQISVSEEVENSEGLAQSPLFSQNFWLS